MAIDSRSTAALALHRFGFGPRPESIAAIASDPRGALLADLSQVDAGRVSWAGMLSGAAAVRESREDRVQRKRERRRQAADGKADERSDSPRASGPGRQQNSSMSPERAMEPEQPAKERAGPPLDARLYFAEAEARVTAALTAEIGLVERLVWFWSNHFCVAAKGVLLRAIAGPFEREAIRRHVLGNFQDMLLAVEGHPAMLVYLDNTRSIGPNSRAGRNRGRGLNENLAREILELHTLGVRTVYTQADVTNFAKILTGWSIVPTRPGRARAGEFEFFAARHEPGAQVVLGKSYPDTGVEQGRAVLKDLANHPATARHIATKLATHFIADAPPESLIARLERRFLDTGGDLKEVTKALIEADEAWNAPRTKLKRPSEWMVSCMRVVGEDRVAIRSLLRMQAMLGESLWRPPSPKGFSDQNSEWIDGIAERLDVATHLSQRLGTLVHPSDLLEQALGPLAGEKTRTTIARAEDRTQALTLLFMAPEFQLR